MGSEDRKRSRGGRGRGTPLAVLACTALAVAVLAAPAGAEVVYDNVPPTGRAEVTGELGSLVQLAGSARLDPRVRAGVVVAPCEAEPAEGTCPPLAVPATLSVYKVDPDREPGQLLARQFKSFELAPDQPLQPLEFSFPGVTLPGEAIVSVSLDSDPGIDPVALALAGQPAIGVNPREAEGVYRSPIPDGDEAGPLAFEVIPAAWQSRQPAFTIEASAVAAPPPPAPTTAAAPRRYRREISIPPSRRMSLGFPRRTARVAGPGALVQVACDGSSAARCIGTLALSAAGTVHKVPFSISKGRKQYVVVPLGGDLARLDGLRAPRATATAKTIQVGGAAVRTKRALRLK